MKWHIGCSGFHYDHWKGRFYPVELPKTKWFNYYCQHFSTLELNVTFYRFPRLSVLQGWYDKSPADFRFSVKVYRGITHFKKFNDTTDLVTRFYEVVNDGLREKLGPVLFQMPPNFVYSDERLERVLNSLDPSFINVFEPRHASWWQPIVFDQLAKRNISFSGMSHPALPGDVIQNTPEIYYRFHGVPLLYTSSYSTEVLQQVIDSIENNPSAKESWIYFNNDSQVAAIENAKGMIGLIKS